jgi:Fur family transcriptional regulator, ferric uptake regulator
VTATTEKMSPAGARWAENARAELARHGHRAGGARQAVIDELATSGGCVDAEHLEARLRSADRSVGTASVYRALSLLAELGLLQRVAVAGSPSRFELVHPDGHHHHHIVCDGCGRTEAFTDAALERAISKASRRSDYEVRSHEVTLHGKCESCR